MAEDILKKRLEIKPDCHGVKLKRLQNEFVNLLPMINEIKDRANMVLSARKARIADIEAEAILAIRNDSNFQAEKSTTKSKVLSALMRTHITHVPYQKSLDESTKGTLRDDGKVVETTLSIEEHMLSLDMYRFNRARSKAEEVNQLLWVCRSGLSFDKEEMQHLSGSQ